MLLVIIERGQLQLSMRGEMGVLCEVFISDAKRAKKYCFRGECQCVDWQSCNCWDEYDSKTYDYIENHRIYEHNFAQLLSVLRGKKYLAEMKKEFKKIKQYSDEGPWIQKVPDDLPRLLVDSTTEELKVVTKAWVGLMSEMYPLPVKDKVFLDYLKLLQKLSKKSVEKKQSMYLWTCL